ncbi:MAG TPA: serine/threonine-protein kinase [Verrucomicrobiota bacterium]|nr:hypothetical protein [Verrucomicrobiales bacterium]HRI12820.1 serine/threonine-protein kinase [Verrucomicrobiota bacterium]
MIEMPGAASQICARCDSIVPPGAPSGQCVHCLLELVELELPLDPDRARPEPTIARRLLGDYELHEELGRGGMGVVFKARRRSLNQWVALKLLTGGQLASEADIFRFHHEAEAAAQLDHPNIVHIYDVDVAEGQHFYAMALVEGRSLDRDLSLFRSDPKAAVALLVKVARALQHAHERGVLHRDLKPGNILIDSAGEPYLTDFGLARRLNVERSLTLTGRILGTPAYLSPEQISGSQAKITVASDLFSLGVVFYGLLTGQHPFTASDDLKILERIRHDEPTSPRRLNPAIDRDLETICLKCLEKDPAKRYATVGAFVDDLERWQRHEPVAARPARWTERTAKWVRRHPVRTITAAAIVLTLLSPTVVATWFILRLNHSRGHHPERRINGHELVLPLFNWHRGRCTDNFPGIHFNEILQQRVRLEFIGVPADVRDTLKVQIHADWAVFPDPIRSRIVGHGAEFVLAVKMERKWLQDNLLYFMRVGWDAGEITAKYTNAAIRLTLLDPPPYNPRVPQ